MVLNRHETVIQAPAEKVFAYLEDMGTDKDVIWPAPSIRFRRSKGAMRVGVSTEKHGWIRGTLCEFKKNEKIVWDCDLSFLKGTHGFYVEVVSANVTKVSHVLSANLRWWFAPIWYFRIAAFHDKVIDELFENLKSVSK